MIAIPPREWGEDGSAIPRAVRDRCAFRCRGYREPRRGRMSVRQHPDELWGLMSWAAGAGVRYYVEVGVEAGGTLCLMDSFLRSLPGAPARTVGVDIEDKTEGFPGYAAGHPGYCSLVVADASSWSPDGRPDLVLVDTNQAYAPMMALARRMLASSRAVALHDVNDSRYGARRAWAELSAEPGARPLLIDHGGPGIGLLVSATS